ncbi:hypothetical protein GCM10008955_24880 [Deinococcus malanensis]|uniref:Bacterial transcriptional activator domain-containing protein n=2 Tax=Deinococcus malanensis TaxID=1706855 RepID=A0ABQ2F0N0_9DEIO|nr:BTAD domain-containing putative transcriptional regulator [Deinococcus malanensis]GGK30148.1 hypothetical protein GCM10008955_24880 [Deinococcus malanensis]
MTVQGQWQLTVLGEPRLVAPDGRQVRCEGRTLAMLTYLALEGPTPRSRLAGLLWPDNTEAVSRNNLVQLLRRFAQSCRAELVHAQEPLALAPTVQVDLEPLLALPQSDQADGDVLDGTLLQGVSLDIPEFEEWLGAERERLDALRVRRLAQAAQHCENQGEWAAATRLIQRLLQLDPLSEDAWRRLMRLHYLSGDPAAALAAYGQCAEVLRADLQVEPLPETQALAADIARGGVLPAAMPPRPLVPVSVLRPPVLVGREDAWRRMEEAWAQGQLIFVSGEPGMGKTRLIADFAASKGRVLALEGRPGDDFAPFTATARNIRRILRANPGLELGSTVREVLSPLVPELGEAHAPRPQLDGRLLEAVGHVFGLGLRDVDVLTVDDMQYCDLATIEAGFLLFGSAFPLGGSSGIPHVICAHRSGEMTPDGEAFIRRQVAEGKAVLIELQALDEGFVRRLVDELAVPDLAALSPRLAQFTGGNPQFLLETVRHLIEKDGLRSVTGRLPLPPKVAEVLTRRLQGLSTGALQAARAAAVLQSDYTFDLVAEVLGAPLLTAADAWAELEAAHIMHGDRFSHDLVYEAVAAGMPAAVGRLLHRSAARVLSGHGVPAGRVARHWLSGGDPARAAPLLLEAAGEAAATGRLREADDLYSLAVSALTTTGDQEGVRQVQMLRATLNMTPAVLQGEPPLPPSV